MVFPTFAVWASTYGKVYNGNEAIVREAIYNDNIVKIQNHNKNGLSWNMSVNGFADLTEDEFLDMFTGISTPASHKDEPTFELSPIEHVELMDSVDWVQRGKVNAIKDQGQCGSCWAFSAMGALESAYAIASGQLLSLAEQQLVDCDSSNTGCKGGWPSKAYDFLAKQTAGVCSEASYSYTARDGNCHASSCTAAIPWGTVTGRTEIAKTSSALKSALQRQPVSVTVNANQLQFYANGIVHGDCQDHINHAVVAVGYGYDNGDYFKLRNSWGSGWGEEGYIRISQSGGEKGTACLLDIAPVIPTLSTSSAACSAHAACAHLAGDCCPTVDDVRLACCDQADFVV